MATSCLDAQAESNAGTLALRPGHTKELTHRAFLNAGASLLDYLARVVVGLLITPVLVAGLGRSLFGVWEMLGRLIGYMSVTDGRPTEALRLVIANQQAIDDPAHKRRCVGSAFAIWLLFLPAFAVAGAILIWLSPLLTKVPPEWHSSVRLTAALLVISFLLANLAALPESVLRGMNLGYRRMGLQAGLNVVGAVLTAAAIYTSLGLIGIAGAQVLLSGITGLLFWLVVKKYVRWFGIAKPSRTEIRSLLKVSVWNSAGNLIAKLHLASDVIILGAVASSSLVTTYVLTGYAALAVVGILTLTLEATSPGLGGLIGEKQYKKTATLRREIMAINWLLVTAAGSTILLWNKSFLHLWVGADYYAGPLVNLLIVLLMAQTVFIRSDSYVIDATLHLRDRVLVSVGAVIISVALSIVLTRYYGIFGLCLGMMGGRLVQTVSYPLIVNSLLGRVQARRFGLIRPGLVMILALASSSFLGQGLLARNWAQWAVGAGVSLGAVLFITPILGLGMNSRESLIKRIKLIWVSIGRQQGGKS